jgi:hypothetical protein
LVDIRISFQASISGGREAPAAKFSGEFPFAHPEEFFHGQFPDPGDGLLRDILDKGVPDFSDDVLVPRAAGLEPGASARLTSHSGIEMDGAAAMPGDLMAAAADGFSAKEAEAQVKVRSTRRRFFRHSLHH